MPGLPMCRGTALGSFLRSRWAAGVTNVCHLFRELVCLGYTGSRTLPNDALRPCGPPRLPKPLRQKRNRRRLDPRRLRRLLTGPPERLSEVERAVVRCLLDAEATVAAGYRLIQCLRQLLKAQDTTALETWLIDAQTCGLPGLAAVADGMLADHAAVAAAVQAKWSTGMVEGHVNNARLQKGLGYGRAGFALLRRRVLAA